MENSKDDEMELTPAVKLLLGSIKALVDFDYKRLLQEEIVKKYG